ncbi:MARTX multifunctional-autoprocessing repeats-in-toxin holotoxin RtxA [Yersinia enterocolitica]|uniref:MARTX multifunctional-autoprocessing repeats-in-toxin holotoxin RtxA n=1 Tax=Yersinia enterocolitica TaxID=630 RepID=UPI003D0506D4
MSKASNRSAEYFFTGVYNGDNDNNDIDAIGLGGVIYARGGDDDIIVGSIAAKVETGSGDDKVKGGAAYLEILDTTGTLTVKGGAGGMNIIKEEDGDIDATVVAAANIITHTGPSGSINIYAIGAYNQITRQSNGYGTNEKLTLDDIVLGSARIKNISNSFISDPVWATKENGEYVYKRWYTHDRTEYTDTIRVTLFVDEETGDIKAEMNAVSEAFDCISRKWRKVYSNQKPGLIDINYNVKTTKIKNNYSADLSEIWSSNYGFFLIDNGSMCTAKDNLKIKAIILSNGDILSAIKSTGKENTYYFYNNSYIYEISINDAVDGKYSDGIDGELKLISSIPDVENNSPQFVRVIPYKLSGARDPEDNLNLAAEIPDGLVERTGEGRIGQYERVHEKTDVPSIVRAAYSIDVAVMVDKKLDIIKPGEILNITRENEANSSDDVNFEGGGIGNVIDSNVITGNVTFTGGGAANIITHTAVKGNTKFTGGGGANIIVKNGGEGNLIFDGVGLGNVLVHKSKKGDMKVNAGGAVNVMVRIGNGQYDVTLTALGNISIHSGDGDSIVKMLGGLNTHTQIGDGEAFWIAAGGLNVLTKKGQGSLFSVVGGGGNVVTNMGQGDSTIVALGLGNIITHISDGEHHARTIVIAVAAANIVTKKGSGDMQAILAGGLNVLTHVGGGKTDAIMLGGGNILTKVGNGDTNGIMFGLGNIFTHMGGGQTLGVMVGAGNIYTKVGNGVTIAAMLAAGNIMTHIGDGNTYVLMAALGNVATKIGDGDLLALMIAKGNVLTQVGNGQTFALMLAKGGNIFTKVGDGMTLAAMISIANVMTHIGDGETFALMIGKANIFTKVGADLTVAAMVGNVNVYSQINNHKNESIGIGIFIGKLNVMTKLGDGTALAIMVGKANVMTHIGNGITGGIVLAKGNIITKVGDGFMGVLAKADGNVITHVGTGITAVVLHGKGNVLTKVGNDTTIGLLISQTGNIMTHIGNGLTIAIAKGKGNIITKVGNGIGINAVWGDLNVITQVGDGERYNFAKGKGNVITRVGNGQEITVAKGDANIVTAVGDIDNYTFAWGKQNLITAVGSGRNVVVAKANNNIVTKVGDGDAYNVLWADNNIVTTVGDGNTITIAKGKINVTTDIGDGLNVTAVYGDKNINTKIGDDTSVNVAWGEYNINTKVGDGLNVAVMKGKANANINVGDGLSVVATYGRNNVSVKVGNGDYYNLSVASSNTKSNKLSALFGNIKQNLLGRLGSQGIDYLVNGNEGQTTGFRNGHGGFNLPEINNLNGFKLDETAVSGKFDSESAPSGFSAKSINNIETPNLESTKNNALKTLGGSDNTLMRDDVQRSKAHAEIENKVGEDKTRAEADGEQLQRFKEEYTANTSVMQSQIKDMDKADLAATGVDYQQQMAQQANELLIEQQKIAQSISNISADKNTETGEGYRKQFAGGLLKDINERLGESIKTANESLDKSQSNVDKYKSAMNDAVAQSESALAKGEQDKIKADTAKATAKLEVAQRKTEAEQQKRKANDANKKAIKEVVTAKRRGEGHLKDANNKSDAAAREAKSVQRSEGDIPKNRREAGGSGLNQNQKAYHADVKAVSDAAISPDEGAISDNHPLAAADGRIVKNISDNIVDIERIKSVEQKVPNKKDNNDSNVSSAGHKQDWLTRVSNKIFFDSNISGKADKKNVFHFEQSSDFIDRVKKDIKRVAEEYAAEGDKPFIKDAKNGVCFALSIKYLIAERNYGPGGGRMYLSWLADMTDHHNNKDKVDVGNDNINKTKNYLLRDYYNKSFESEFNDIISLQKYSDKNIDIYNYIESIGNVEDKNKGKDLHVEKLIELVKKDLTKRNILIDDKFFNEVKDNFNGKQSSNDSIYNELKAKVWREKDKINAKVSDFLQENGFHIKSESKYRVLNSRTDGYERFMDGLKNPTQDVFIPFLSRDHAMAISVMENNGVKHWSFFDPNFGAVTFNSFDKFSDFMDKSYKNNYGIKKLLKFHNISGAPYFSSIKEPGQTFKLNTFTLHSDESKGKIVNTLEESRRGEEAFVLKKMKEENIQFKFDKSTKGKVVDFTYHQNTNQIDSITLEISDKKNSNTHRVNIPASGIIGAVDNISPYISKIRKLEGHSDLRMMTGEENIRFVSNNPEEPTKDILTIKLPRLKTLGDGEYNPLKVDEWDRTQATEELAQSSTRYHSQIIVQLENDPIAAEAAANLAAKHPGSILVQLDSDGQYRVISGDPTSLQGNIRWQLVGHGRDNSNGQGNQTMANSSPVELAARVKNLQDKLDNKYRIRSTPNYISLVGCTLVDKTQQHGFARQFITALNNQGIQADVAARSSRVLINEQGEKITLDADGNFRHKANEDKVILRLNKEQKIETVSEKVRNNIHVSEIDIHRVGAKDIDLPAGGAIGRNTEEFSPPERKKRIDTLAPSTDNNQAVSYSGNINIQIGDNEFTSINYGTSNLGIKVGHGGFKTLVFGDNNIMIHIGDGMSKHSVNIGGYQAFEGVQVFMGTRNISFNHGHSNDLIFMTEKTVLSPPLVNPFDGSTRVCVALENIANEGNGGDWLQAQAQQWTLAGAKRYLNDLSALDSTSSVDYNSLIEIDSQLIRSGRGLKSDINATLNKKYNQWLGKQSTEGNISQVKTTKADKLRKLNDTLVFNIAVGGQGADIIVTNSNWNFTFGDNIASIMDVNLGSLFAISTQQVTKSGRVKTTMTYSIDDMPRQIKNQLINKLSLVESDMTLGDIFGVDYDAEGNIVSRTGEDIDGEKVLKEMLEVVAEFGGEKLKTLSDPQKLLNGLKANLNMGENAITSFAQTHGLQDKAPDEVGKTAAVNTSGSTTTQPPEKTDQAFGFSSLNLPNLFATLFNKDKQTEMEEMGNNLKQNMARDLLNMEEKTFDFLRNSGFLRGDGDLNWSLGNYNFTLGGHGNDLGAYLGDNNNFWGGKGDDTFYGMGISNVFTGGQGNDTGVLMGRENTMFGGAGDDITVLAGRINHADLGAGNDKAFIFGEAGTANMGDGDDYVVIAGNYNRTDGEQGQDYVVLMGNNNVAKLGEGNDHCVVFGNENTVSGDQGSDTIKLMGYSSVILGSDGNDHLIADVISKFSEFLGGEGDDILELGGYQNQFSGLDGVDSFIVSTSVIDCTVTDISREDKILINNVSWRDLWLQRNGYDLTILVRRPITDDSAQGDFERVGSVTFNDYFNGKRAAIVVSDKGIDADSGGYEALADSAIDGLVQNMNNFSVSDEKSSFIGQMDTQIQQQIAGLWANTTRNAA